MSFIASIFGGGKKQAPPPPAPDAPAPPPTVDQAAINQDYEDQMRKRRGSASTILVPNGTDTTMQLGQSGALLGG